VGPVQLRSLLDTFLLPFLKLIVIATSRVIRLVGSRSYPPLRSALWPPSGSPSWRTASTASRTMRFLIPLSIRPALFGSRVIAGSKRPHTYAVTKPPRQSGMTAPPAPVPGCKSIDSEMTSNNNPSIHANGKPRFAAAKPHQAAASSQHKTLTLRGDRGQCAACREYFNSTYAFDKHRVGRYSPMAAAPGSSLERRCLNPSEMRAKGMSLSSTGFWITKPRSARSFADADSTRTAVRSSRDVEGAATHIATQERSRV
jgi:hypothetical protein